MPFVSVKCPSCGGDIQLDDSRESGFCVYCGAKVMYKEAVQKIEGSVTVEGIAGLEKMLANAETFHKLKETDKENELLDRVTKEYPEDWRGWWRKALRFDGALTTDEIEANLNDRLYCRFTIGSFSSEYPQIREIKTKPIDNALALAPSEKVPEIKKKIRAWLESQIKLYTIILSNVYEDVRDAMNQKKEDERVHNIAVECRERTKQIVDKDSRKMLSKHLIFDDVEKNELMAAGLSPQYWKETRIRQLHMAWGMDTFNENSDQDDVDCCLDMHEKVEENLEKAIAYRQQLLKKYCGQTALPNSNEENRKEDLIKREVELMKEEEKQQADDELLNREEARRIYFKRYEISDVFTKLGVVSFVCIVLSFFAVIGWLMISHSYANKDWWLLLKIPGVFFLLAIIFGVAEGVARPK